MRNAVDHPGRYENRQAWILEMRRAAKIATTVTSTAKGAVVKVTIRYSNYIVIVLSLFYERDRKHSLDATQTSSKTLTRIPNPKKRWMTRHSPKIKHLSRCWARENASRRRANSHGQVRNKAYSELFTRRSLAIHAPWPKSY